MKTRQSHLRFYVGLLTAFVGGLAVLAALHFSEIGKPTDEGASRCSLLLTKAEQIRQQPGRRMIFIGGSGVHWGINAQRVGDALGYKGMNYGGFAALGPDIPLWEARKFARAGDVVVVAPEYDMLTGQGLTSQALDYVMTCRPDYLDRLSALERARIVLGVDITRPLRHVARRASFVQAEAKRRFSSHGDPYPDDRSYRPVAPADRARMALFRPILIPRAPSPEVDKSLRDFIAWSRSENVTVIMTWPNTIYFDEYTKSASLHDLEGYYRSLGVPVAGKPTDSMLPLPLFYDTQYHLGAAGVHQRTEKLVSELRPIIDQEQK
jgi:hypothetical protein